jgi:hypothetical protein
VGNVIFVAHVDDPTRAMSLCRREGDRERRLPLVEGMELLVGDLIDTGSSDPYAEEIRPVRAKVSIRSGTLDLADETHMEAVSGKEVRMVGDCGLLYAETRSILAASQLTVRTRHAVVSPSSGTTLDVSVADGGTAVTVEKGKAAVRNERGSVSVATRQKSVARANRKPSPPVAVYAHAVWRGRKGPLEIPPIKGKVAVRSFTLIDADRDVPIAGFDPLPTGSVVLNLAKLPTRNLNIRANTVPDDGISVRFDLNSKIKHKLEQVAPYAFQGDRFSDYDAWTPRVGTYVIKATPFPNLKGLGAPGKALQLTIKIIEQ